MAEEAVLGFLEHNDEIENSGTFADERGIDHQELVNVIKSLHGFELVVSQDIKKERPVLTKEGETYAATGSPEVQVFLAVPPEAEGILLKDLQTKTKLDPSAFKIGRSHALKNQWVKMEGQQVLRKVENVEDKVQMVLKRVEKGEDIDKKEIAALIKPRNLIAIQTWKGYSVKKGPKYTPKRKKMATDLTRENLQSGDWKNLEFKRYNFNAKGQPTEAGCLNPLLKMREQFKMIFLQMGTQTAKQLYTVKLLQSAKEFVYIALQCVRCSVRFEEMSTNNFVESSFWNFDALFQPQQHPARDSHDTFFLADPSTTKTLPEDYVERVKRVHEIGGYESRGYAYDWKREEANKNLLRTHTTAVSSRMLYKLAQEGFAPKKYFSIDRVFRNEAVDKTHLAEFHQVEGLVCDRGLTLGDLMGVIETFFARLGMSELKYKPAYNPYTEPSMEIFGYHDGLGKWVEIGNSGMFRPEMLRPMGLPEDVKVIAWGLSLERPTMILNKIDNIRNLFGHKVDLGLIEESPICRIGI